MDNGFKVLMLNIVNNRLIKAFKARLNGGHLEIAGKKGTGKTTASSVLWEIMTPGRDRITHGEKKSVLTAILSDGVSQITATRTYLPSGSTTSIMKQTPNEDGIMEIVPVSHKDFKAMLSSLSSNPQDIRNMKAKDKVALLLESAGIPPESYEAIDAAVANAARELGDAQSEMKKHVLGEKEPAKADPMESNILAEKIAEINKHNQRYSATENELSGAELVVMSKKDSLASANKDLSVVKNEIRYLENRIKELKIEQSRVKDSIRVSESDVEKAINHVSRLKARLDDMDLIPPEKISELIAENAKMKEVALKYKEWEERRDAYARARKNLGEAMGNHKAALKAKKEVMDGAEFPLDGLSIDDGDLWYNGILVDNLGTSEQMLVYGSLAVEDALSHDIRAVRMDGIESMGQEDYDKLRDLATEKGVQLFATRVTWEEKILDTEILIVDGHYPDEDEKE